MKFKIALALIYTFISTFQSFSYAVDTQIDCTSSTSSATCIAPYQKTDRLGAANLYINLGPAPEPLQINRQTDSQFFKINAFTDSSDRIPQVTLDMRPIYASEGSVPLNINSARGSDVLLFGGLIEQLNINVSGRIGGVGKSAMNLCAQRVLAGEFGAGAATDFSNRRSNPANGAPVGACDAVDLKNVASHITNPAQVCPSGYTYLNGADDNPSPSISFNRYVDKQECYYKKPIKRRCEFIRYRFASAIANPDYPVEGTIKSIPYISRRWEWLQGYVSDYRISDYSPYAVKKTVYAATDHYNHPFQEQPAGSTFSCYDPISGNSGNVSQITEKYPIPSQYSPLLPSDVKGYMEGSLFITGSSKTCNYNYANLAGGRSWRHFYPCESGNVACSKLWSAGEQIDVLTLSNSSTNPNSYRGSNGRVYSKRNRLDLADSAPYKDTYGSDVALDALGNFISDNFGRTVYSYGSNSITYDGSTWSNRRDYYDWAQRSGGEYLVWYKDGADQRTVELPYDPAYNCGSAAYTGFDQSKWSIYQDQIIYEDSYQYVAEGASCPANYSPKRLTNEYPGKVAGDLATTSCSILSCPKVSVNIVNESKSLEALSPALGERGTLGGSAKVFAYDIVNSSFQFQNGQHGATGNGDVPVVTTSKYCYSLKNSSLEELMRPVIDVTRVNFSLFSKGSAPESIYSPIPVRTQSDAISIFSDIDQSTRDFIKYHLCTDCEDP